jgi:hypothetical protein
MASFRHTIRFARTHNDQAKICGQRCIVGVDRVEREVGCSWELDEFRTDRFQFAAKNSVLRLGLSEIGCVMKA